MYSALPDAMSRVLSVSGASRTLDSSGGLNTCHYSEPPSRFGHAQRRVPAKLLAKPFLEKATYSGSRGETPVQIQENKSETIPSRFRLVLYVFCLKKYSEPNIGVT